MKNLIKIVFLLLCAELHSFAQISEVLSFKKERFLNDNQSYPKAQTDGENRVPNFALSASKVFSVENYFEGTNGLLRGQNVGVFRFNTNYAGKKYFLLYDNNFAYTGKEFQDLNINELNNLAGDAAQGDIIGTDFENHCNYNHPNTSHNLAYLFYRIKQIKPSAICSINYTLSGPSYGSNNLKVSERKFTVFDSNGWVGNGLPATAAIVYNSPINQVNGGYNIAYSDCGNKTLWELIDYWDVSFIGYDAAWVSPANNEDGITANTAQAIAFLGGLNGFNLIQKSSPMKKIRGFFYQANESAVMNTTYYSKTSEGNVIVQDKIAVVPSIMEAAAFWSLWKGVGFHSWDNGKNIVKSEDANLTSNVFPNGAGQGLNLYMIRVNDGLSNYNQAYYNNLYGNKLPATECGQNYDELVSGAFKYSQIEAIFGNAPNQLPTTFEYARSTIDNSGTITYSNYQSVSPPTNGAVYANAAANKVPCLEFRQVGNSYAVLVHDLYPNNANNPTKVRVTLGGSSYEMTVWGTRFGLFKIN